jgi:hypothetical protein
MTLHRWSGLALLGWLGALAVACGDDDDSDPSGSGGGSAGRGGSRAMGGGDNTGGRIAPTGGRPSTGGGAGAPGVAGDDAGGAGSEPTGGRASGGRPSTGGSNDGGSTVEAGAGGTTASGGNNATGGTATPSGGAPPQGTHIPDVAPTQTGEVFAGDSVEGFDVTDSHYYVEGSPQSITDHYWLGVIVNNGDEMKCRLTVSVSLEAPGSAPVKFVGPVVAPMYRFQGLTNRVYCLAPGERGVAVAQPFEVAPQFAAEDITAVTYGVAGEMAGDVVPAEWVQLGNVEIEDDGAKSRVTGDIENTSTAAVSSIVALVFPKNTAGAPLAYFRIADERASAPEGTVWHFESPFYDGNFEDADVFYEHGAPGAP